LQGGSTLDAHRIQAVLALRSQPSSLTTSPPLSPAAPTSYRSATYQHASSLLARYGGNVRRTYRALGVPRSTFYRWLREGKIRRPTLQLT
jgi:transcriptional regulator of acetoin/glycerol metabolism